MELVFSYLCQINKKTLDFIFYLYILTVLLFNFTTMETTLKNLPKKWESFTALKIMITNAIDSINNLKEINGISTEEAVKSYRIDSGMGDSIADYIISNY